MPKTCAYYLQHGKWDTGSDSQESADSYQHKYVFLHVTGYYCVGYGDSDLKYPIQF